MKVDRFPIEAGHINRFLRALGGAPGGDAANMAPPTFMTAAANFDLEWPYRPEPGKLWIGSAGESSELRPIGDEPGSTSLHAEQEYEYHLAARPGDILRAQEEEGATWERDSSRSGKLTFEETITRFWNQDDELVVTARRVRVLTRGLSSEAARNGS